MTYIRKAIISTVAAILTFATVSCHKDDTLYYNNLTMGNIVEGRFVSDQGNTFNIVEQICPGNLASQTRAMVLCDVLNNTEGADKEYDIRLTNFAPVLDKDAISLSSVMETDEASVQDPIHIAEIWYSGGYLNIHIKFHAKQESELKHLINLVWSKDEEGKYILNLRHNGFGEVYSKDNASEMYIANGYVSFPIIKFIEETEAKLILNWKWYNSPGTGYDFNTEKEYSIGYEWKRSGFEQVPKNVELKSVEIL